VAGHERKRDSETETEKDRAWEINSGQRTRTGTEKRRG